jgi:hypothetical protein
VEIRKCGHVIYAALHDVGHLVPWLSERTYSVFWDNTNGKHGLDTIKKSL